MTAMVRYGVLSLVCVDDISLPDGRNATGVLGGAGTYAAAGLALAGAEDIGIISGIGADFTSEHLSWFDTWKFDTSAMTIRGPRTVRSSLVYEPSFERVETSQITPGEIRSFEPSPTEIPQEWLPLAGIYVLRDCDQAFWNTLQETLSPKTCVLWEILGSAAVPGNWSAVAKLLPSVDIFSINQTEAKRLCDSEDLNYCLSRLMEAGARQVSLRLGADGALHALGSERFVASSCNYTHFVDPTGAGNTHGGALLAAWTKSGNLRHAAAVASAAASLAIEQHGPPQLDDATRETMRARAANCEVREESINGERQSAIEISRRSD